MFNKEQVELAANVVRHYGDLKRAGDPKAFPYPLYLAIMTATVQVAVEAIIIDGEGNYMLVRRPPNEKKYGANKLHVLGGFVTPGSPSMLAASRRTQCTT